MVATVVGSVDEWVNDQSLRVIVGSDFETNVSRVDFLELNWDRDLLSADHLVSEEALLVLGAKNSSNFKSMIVNDFKGGCTLEVQID